MQRGTIAVVAAATLATVAYIAASAEEDNMIQQGLAIPQPEHDDHHEYDDDFYDEDYSDQDDYPDYGERRRRQ